MWVHSLLPHSGADRRKWVLALAPLTSAPGALGSSALEASPLGPLPQRWGHGLTGTVLSFPPLLKRLVLKRDSVFLEQVGYLEKPKIASLCIDTSQKYPLGIRCDRFAICLLVK